MGAVGNDGRAGKDDISDKSPREWCTEALTRLNAGRPESALEAARRAADLDPGDEWAHRLVSLAHERLGRDADALPPAERAADLAPGSWSARVRLASIARRIPGRWSEAVSDAVLAARFAPEEADPEVLLGDLALLRDDHPEAERAYRAALARAPAHPQARVNLALCLLRWDRPRPHHDPAWPVDPRQTGRARRALEVWARQVRLLLALAVIAVAAAALALDAAAWARAGGFAALAALVPLTVRQARRVGVWAYVPAMAGRDPWLGAAVVSAGLSVPAFAAWLLLGAVPAAPSWLDPVWAGLAGIVVLMWPALAVVRVLAEAWRGRPLPALAELGSVPGERTAARNAGVTLWIVLVRTWSVLVPLVGGALAVEPRAAVAAVAVPFPMVRAWLRARGRGDGWLLAAGCLVALAALGCAVGGALGSAWGWRVGLGALGAAMAVYAVRALRSWWRGAPGPWRASLVMCDLPMGGAPSVALPSEVRQAFSYARSLVLAYGDPMGPRVVGAAGSVTSSGELRLIAGPEAWEGVEADPRVAVFAADPLQRRFWVEVRGIARPGPDVLRVTPKQVLVGEFPGRHQRR
ncbi:hypothetical protein [Nonomuraea sp. NPDC001699]